MDTVFAFGKLSLGAEADAPLGDSLLSPRGTSVGLFATTLLLALSESTGEDSLVSVRLFWHKEVSPVCGGVIANSGDGMFCTKRTCAVKSHRASKVMLKDNHLYIMGTEYEGSSPGGASLGR
jgi:hypothetical protein